MFDIIIRIALLIPFSFAIIYGLITIKKNKNTKPIFMAAFIAMIAFLLSRLFFLVLMLADGDDTTFSIGILGQMAGYFFLILATKSCLPFIEKYKFTFKGLFILLIPLACYSYCIISSRGISEIICSILYSCSTSLILYFSFNNLLLSKNSENFRKIRGFNICILIITINGTIESLLAFITNQTILYIVTTIIACASITAISLALPLLKKEVSQYDC